MAKSKSNKSTPEQPKTLTEAFLDKAKAATRERDPDKTTNAILCAFFAIWGVQDGFARLEYLISEMKWQVSDMDDLQEVLKNLAPPGLPEECM